MCATHFAGTVFETIMPRNVRVSEAPSLWAAGPDLRSPLRRRAGLYPAGGGVPEAL